MYEDDLIDLFPTSNAPSATNPPSTASYIASSHLTPGPPTSPYPSNKDFETIPSGWRTLQPPRDPHADCQQQLRQRDQELEERSRTIAHLASQVGELQSAITKLEDKAIQSRTERRSTVAKDTAWSTRGRKLESLIHGVQAILQTHDKGAANPATTVDAVRSVLSQAEEI